MSNGLCKICGAEKSAKDHIYCSRKCAGVDFSVSFRTGSRFSCEQCGVEFWRKLSAIAKGDCRFCSRACYFVAQKGWKRPGPAWDRRGEKNPNFGKKATPETIAKLVAAGQRRSQRNSLRKPTCLERLLYAALEELGIEYVPQRPTGPFVVDAYIPGRRVALEVDGAFWHARPWIQEKDAREAEWMKNAGVTLIRISEAEAVQDCVAALRKALNDRSTDLGGLPP